MNANSKFISENSRQFAGNFFDDPDRVAQLRAEIDSWLETPFHAYSKAKGRTGGVDCIRLNEAIAIALGVVEPFEFPRVPMDFTQHNDRSITLEFLRGEYRLEDGTIDPQSTRLAARYAELDHSAFPTPRSEFSPLPGDLVTFKVGKAVNHLGTVYDEARFVHCLKGIGTVLSRFDDDTYAKRLHTVFRARRLTADDADNTDQNPESSSAPSAKSAVKI
jgi:hypothetical protein